MHSWVPSVLRIKMNEMPHFAALSGGPTLMACRRTFRSAAPIYSSRPSANLIITAVSGSSALTDIPPSRRRQEIGMRLPLTSTASYEAHSVRDPENNRSLK